MGKSIKKVVRQLKEEASKIVNPYFSSKMRNSSYYHEVVLYALIDAAVCYFEKNKDELKLKYHESCALKKVTLARQSYEFYILGNLQQDQSREIQHIVWLGKRLSHILKTMYKDESPFFQFFSWIRGLGFFYNVFLEILHISNHFRIERIRTDENVSDITRKRLKGARKQVLNVIEASRRKRGLLKKDTKPQNIITPQLTQVIQNDKDIASLLQGIKKTLHMSAQEIERFCLEFSRKPPDRHRALLNQIDLETKGPKGESWLHVAAAKGHITLLQALLDAGCYHIDVVDDMGDTPLHKAVLGNQFDIVKKLVKRGADVNKNNGAGQSSLKLANGESVHSDIQNCLLQAACNSKTSTASGGMKGVATTSLSRELENTHIRMQRALDEFGSCALPDIWADENDMLRYIRGMTQLEKGNSQVSVADSIWDLKATSESTCKYFCGLAFPLKVFIEDFLCVDTKTVFLLPLKLLGSHFCGFLIHKHIRSNQIQLELTYINPQTDRRHLKSQAGEDDKAIEDINKQLIEVKQFLKTISKKVPGRSYIDEISKGKLTANIVKALKQHENAGIIWGTIVNQSCGQQHNGNDCGYIVAETLVNLALEQPLKIGSYEEDPEKNIQAIAKVRDAFVTSDIMGKTKEQREDSIKRQYIERLARAISMNEDYAKPLRQWIKNCNFVDAIETYQLHAIIFSGLKDTVDEVERILFGKRVSTSVHAMLEDRVISILTVRIKLYAKDTELSAKDYKLFCDSLLEPYSPPVGDVIFRCHLKLQSKSVGTKGVGKGKEPEGQNRKYDDCDINNLMNVMAQRAQRALSIAWQGKEFLIGAVIKPDMHIYIAKTSAIDSRGLSSPVNYFFDKEKRREDAGIELLKKIKPQFKLLKKYDNDLKKLREEIKKIILPLLKENEPDEGAIDFAMERIQKANDQTTFDRKIKKMEAKHRSIDVFDELMALLDTKDTKDTKGKKAKGVAKIKRVAKIVFPYNISQHHWLAGEINIRRQGNKYIVDVYSHDPFGGGKMKKENFRDLRLTIEKRIKEESFHKDVTVEVNNKQSPYTKRRQGRGDRTSCGVIVVEDMLKIIKGETLDRKQPYPFGAMAIRKRHIKVMQKFYSSDNPTLVTFLSKNKHTVGVKFGSCPPSKSDFGKKSDPSLSGSDSQQNNDHQYSVSC